MQENGIRPSKVDLLLPSSCFQEEKGEVGRNTCTSTRTSLLCYQWCPPLPVLCLSTVPRAKSTTGFFLLPPADCWGLLPPTGITPAVLKASSAQGETAPLGSQINAPPALEQTDEPGDRCFIYLSSNTWVNPIHYLLYLYYELQCTTNRKRKQIMRNNEIGLESNNMLEGS